VTAPFRVVHVITRLDPGGSATSTLLTVDGLAGAYQQSLVYGRTRQATPLLAALRGRVELVELPALVREPAPLRDARACRALYRLMRRSRPDLVHTHTSKAGILGRLAAWLAGVPRIVHTPHGHVFHGYAGRLRTRGFVHLEGWAARVTDRIVGLTDQEARDHLAHGIGRPEQFVTIPSGIDLAPFDKPHDGGHALRAALGLPAAARIVGAVGRLEPIKGHRHLVEAFAELAPRVPDLYLVLVGDGECEAALRARLEAAGLGARVRFLGWREDVATVLPALDVFAFPSLNEGMGRALVEAMAAGRPIVAARAGGIPEVLADGAAGLLVPAGEGPALARAIERLLADPALGAQLGEAARRRAAQYSVTTMLARTEQLYRELLEGPARR
jgi:glycosyltransferase involved in cell wall biosynthesis